MKKVPQILYTSGSPPGRSLMRALLRGAEGGFRVAEARSFDEFRVALGTGDPDLIVGDLALPGCAGYELVEEAQARRPDVSLVILNADKDRALGAYQRGASSCLGVTVQDLQRLPQIVRRAIERRAFEREQKEMAELLRRLTRAREVMAECNRVLVRAGDEPGLLQEMCRIVAETGGYRLAWVGMVEHDAQCTIRPVASAGEHGGHLADTRISWADNEFGRGPAGLAVRTGRPHAAQRIQADTYFNTWRRPVMARGFEAAAALPLVSDGEVLGVLGILATEPEAFDPEELALLDQLAHDIAYGLTNLRLRAARKREQNLLALEHAVTRSLARAEGGVAALQAVMRAVCETEGWDCGRYFRVDEAAGVLRFEQGWGVASPGIQAFLERSRTVTYKPGAGVAGKVWESGRPLWIADLNQDARALRAAYTVESGIRGAFIFPVESRGKTVGVLAFSSREIREPDERLLQAARMIGSQIGQFLQRAHNEDELRRFRAALDVSPDLVMLVDPASMRYIDVNDATCRALGYRREELLALGPTELFCCAAGEDLNRIYERVVAGERQAPAEGWYRCKDGSRLLVEAYRRAVHSTEGVIIAVVARDITERRSRETELQRFRAAMDTSSDMIMLIDRATMRYVDVNATACEMQGYTREEMLRMGPQDVGGLTREHLERVYDGMIATGQTTWQKSVHRGKDGKNLPVEIFRRAVRSDQGWIIVAIVRDVSERARAEQLQNLEHGVARCLSGAESTAAATTAVIRAICESEDWECGRYFRVDEAAGALRFEQAWHVPDPAFEQFVERSRDAVYRPGDGLVGRAWQSGEPLWSTDLREDPRARTRHYSLDMGIRAALIFPITAEGRTIGVLSFSSRKDRSADDGLLRAVHAIGSQIGQFLQRKQAEAVLRESEARFRSLTTLSSDWYWEQDAEYRFVDMTSEIDRRTGVSALAHIGKRRWELAAPNMTDADWAAHRAVVEAHRPFHDLELCREAADGTLHWVSINGEPIFDAEGRFKGYRGIGKNITARKREEQLLNLEHTVTRRLAEADSAAAGLQAVIRAICESEGWECGRYLRWDEEAGVLRFSASWSRPDPRIERFLEAKRDTLLRPGEGLAGNAWQTGHPIWVRDVSADARCARTAIALETKMHCALHFPVISEGIRIGMLAFNGHAIREPDQRLLQAIQVIGSQIGRFLQHKQGEERLAHLAEFDMVTGLPNRHLFCDRLGQALIQAQRNDWLGGVLFVDLDRFKAVNDTFGHSVGDELLKRVAARIKECVRSGDTVARLSGDEFAVVLTTLARADDAGLVAQKIVQALAAPFDLDGHQTYISASVGIALYPADGADADALLKNADTAMYRAKEQGRNCYQFYLPQMNDRLMERLQLEARLRGALDRREFLLHYQPKVQLDTGAISGFEALLRWKQTGKLISPAEFIPILEETGLIVPVGEWVLRSVCEQLSHWKARGLTPRPVAVNLSARQFQHRHLATMVEQILRETGVAPELLELELTETLLMSDAEEAVQMLRELKSLGVRLAVDDFGTGYSSLAYLKRFPLDTLKIDRAFINDAVSNPDDATLTVTIINLAHSMRLKVVAEGVETQGQLNFLRLHGCDEMQGYYFARPMPVEDCTQALLEDRRLQKSETGRAADVPTLLLVDDNPDDLVLLEHALASDQFQIITARNATAGLEILARHGADIVVSDQDMPGMNGIDFLTHVRRLYPDALRLVASGNDDAPTIKRAINGAGVHKFLFKGWNPDRLRAEVRDAYAQSLVRKSASGEASQVRRLRWSVPDEAPLAAVA